MNQRTALRDGTRDRDGAGRLVPAGEAAEGDDSHRDADGEGDPPSLTHRGAHTPESAESIAVHRRWLAAAAACAAAAAVLLFTVGVNAAFVAAVLGMVAWFWDQRNSIRAGIVEDENSEEGRDELEEFGEGGGRGEDAR